MNRHAVQGFGLLGLAVLLFSACSQSETDAPQNGKRELVLPVQIGKVIVKDVVDEVRTVGNIVAEQRVIITAEVDGRIQRLPVEEGASVQAGDRIALIDSREYRLKLERIKAELLNEQ